LAILFLFFSKMNGKDRYDLRDLYFEKHEQASGKNTIVESKFRFYINRFLDITQCVHYCNSIKSLLGPVSKDKILMDKDGEILLTNDGATFLKEVVHKHPICTLLTKLSITMDDEGGDGTTSVVILSGSILEESLRLILQNMHPHTIIRGFQEILPHIERILDEISIKFDPIGDSGKEIFLQVAKTTLNSKFVSFTFPKLANLVVDAVLQSQGNLKRIQIVKAKGKSLYDSKHLSGIAIQSNLVLSKQDAVICLIAFDLNKPKTSSSYTLNVSSSIQLDRLIKEEEEYTKKILISLKKLKVDLILIQENIIGAGISDLAKQLASKLNISCVTNVSKNTMRDLCYMCSTCIITGPDQISPKRVFTANITTELFGEVNYVLVNSNKLYNVMVLQESSKMALDEAERAVHDCLRVLEGLYQNPSIVSGGGSCEFQIAQRIRSIFADQPNLIQANAFGDALLQIPRVLAENCGFNVYNTMQTLKELHPEPQNKHHGIHSEFGVCNVQDKGLIEPSSNKLAQIEMALQCALQILKIDKNMISNNK
jgi:chaperonin GroEL (HSP60 family)